MKIRAFDIAALIEGAARLDAIERAVNEAAEAIARATDTGSIVDFFDVPTADTFDVPPAQAIEYFKGKGLKPTFSYADMIGEAHDHAFTVAKMMDVDLLKQVKDSLEMAQAQGKQFKEWADELLPILQSSGWWGRKEMIDPVTGKTLIAQLGSPWRLETIFRTNLQTAYAAGQWEMIESQADVAPFLMYDAVDDHRTRPAHAAWDRTVLPVTSKWWRTHYPPNGWSCRCSVIQLDQDQLDTLGLKHAKKAPDGGTYPWQNPRTGEVVDVPKGLDPGFDKNSGREYIADLKRLQAQKVKQLDKAMQAAAKEADAKVKDQVAKLQELAKQTAAEIVAADAIAAANLQALKDRAMATAKELAAQDAIDLIASGKLDPKSPGAGYKLKGLQAAKKLAEWPEMTATQKLAAIEENAAIIKKAQHNANH